MRTDYCTNFSKNDIGKEIELCGWADSYRDHGGVIFIDLRDRSGIIQLVVEPENEKYQLASEVKNEYVNTASENVSTDVSNDGLTTTTKTIQTNKYIKGDTIITEKVDAESQDDNFITLCLITPVSKLTKLELII